MTTATQVGEASLADVTRGKSGVRIAWLLGGALIVGLGFALQRLVDSDIDLDLDWDNLPA